MKNELTQILRHYFNKDSVEELNESEVRNLSDQYPYFSAGHIILAKYLLQKDAVNSVETANKTALYLCNPLWLNAFIASDLQELPTSYSASNYEPLNVNESTQLVANESILIDEADQQDSITDNDQEYVIVNDQLLPDDGTEQTAELTDEVAITSETETLLVADEEVETDFIESIELHDEVTTISHEEQGLSPDTGNSDEVAESEFVQEPPTLQPAQIFENAFTEDTHSNYQEDPGLESSEDSNQNVNDQVPDTPAHDKSEAAPPPSAEPEQIQPATSGFESKPDVQTAAATEITDPGQLAFEPFHTVDYFASQGIKLQQAELGQDKLGKQLRSFTEWLRSMKRLPQTEVTQADDTTIHRIAEHSLEDKEILTEAMAEVWLKQGNREKAAFIYRKLSLQNPSKSSYFAAKIDQLNSF